MVEKIFLWDVCGLGSPVVWKAAKGTVATVHNSYGPLFQLEYEHISGHFEALLGLRQ